MTFYSLKVFKVNKLHMFYVILEILGVLEMAQRTAANYVEELNKDTSRKLLFTYDGGGYFIKAYFKGGHVMYVYYENSGGNFVYQTQHPIDNTVGITNELKDYFEGGAGVLEKEGDIVGNNITLRIWIGNDKKKPVVLCRTMI